MAHGAWPIHDPPKKDWRITTEDSEKNLFIAGWWLSHPSEKYESQLGLLFPIYGKIKAMFQTTKQIGILRSCWMQDSLILIPGCSPLWNLEQCPAANKGEAKQSQIFAVSDWLRYCTTNGAVLLVYFSGYISGSKFGPTSVVIIIMFIHMYTINLYPFVTTFMHQRSARPTSDLSGKLWIPAGFFGCGDNDLSSRIGIVLGQDLSQPKIRGSSQGGD